MTSKFHFGAVALAFTLVGLAGCGGGGGGKNDDGGSGGGNTTFPSSGAYGWILKSSGPTDALKFGLSLVHPSTTTTDTEYVIESASLNVTDARLVSSGSVDTSARRATSVQPHSLVYIVGGDVRAVPMQADGTAPLSKVQRSNSTSACRFLISANDYAAPLNSRYIVSTAGTDGDCNTIDDARAEARFNGSGGLVYTPLAGDPPLDVARDPATLAPRGWIYAREVVLWNTNLPAIELRDIAAPDITSVVASTYRQALVEDGTRLGVIDFSGSRGSTEIPLDAATTAGVGWQLIGFDAESFYVYRNSGSTFTSTWTVLEITRNSPTATAIATGSGLVASFSMGSDVLYLTVFGQADNRLVRINKTGGTPAETVVAATTFLSVQTSASDVHLLWRVTNVRTPSAVYTIEFIGENSATPLLPAISGGFPINVADASTQNFNTSESRNRFVFASGFTAARAFNGATLETFDAATSTSRVLGALPGSADFGTDFGTATAIGGPSGVGLAFAARSSGGNVQEDESKVYSYDLGTAKSLKPTTTTVP